jgi:hypothetical protein
MIRVRENGSYCGRVEDRVDGVIDEIEVVEKIN